MTTRLHILIVLLATSLTAFSQVKENSVEPTIYKGDYFGQTPPGDSAVLFAPNAISSALNDRDFAISPLGDEIFFSREAGNFTYTTIFHTQRIDGIWTAPEVFMYCTNPRYKYIEPHLSSDGKKLYFISNHPFDSSFVGNEDIWVSAKVNGKWAQPKNLGAPVNTKSKEFFPSVTNAGTIYFTHFDSVANDEYIYRSRLLNGAYQQPEKLGPNVNIGKARYNAFVAADERYIIVPAYGMTDSYGGTDYYISFRDSLDNWSQPINMGPKINTSNPKEWSAATTTDGKYLFFMSAHMGDKKLEKLTNETMQSFFNAPQNGNTDIYWISSSVIQELELKAVY